MALRSKLFQGDSQLEAAAVSDAAHITPGSAGPHVGKIQRALITLDGARITIDSMYGPATAAAVLAYKTKRQIINTAYQRQADDIVGRMTIASLDEEMAKTEEPAPAVGACVLYSGCPVDCGGRQFAPRSSAALVAAPAPPPNAPAIMAEARRFSRQCLWDARGDIVSVTSAIRTGAAFAPAQDKTFATAVKWLNLNAADRPSCAPHLDKAAELMLRNFNLKLPGGGDIVMSHAVGATYHGLTELNRPDLGLKCGDTFFHPDGPNCRRDVVTHEFFHLFGIRHGGGALMGPTIRSAITTTAQALDSADNLAQLVAELRTFKSPNTDACVRPGD